MNFKTSIIQGSYDFKSVQSAKDKFYSLSAVKSHLYKYIKLSIEKNKIQVPGQISSLMFKI